MGLNGRSMLPGAQSVRVRFHDMTGIKLSSQVRYAGAPAGTVSAVRILTAAEHAARRVAMKNAADAASDMVKDLTRVYNRGRQGKITQEIAEITGAVEAMA